MPDGWTVTIEVDTDPTTFTYDALGALGDNLEHLAGTVFGDPDQHRWGATVSIAASSRAAGRRAAGTPFEAAAAARVAVVLAAQLAGVSWGTVARVETVTFAEQDRLLAEQQATVTA